MPPFQFWKVQGAHAPLGLAERKERGVPPLCFGVERERERVNASSLVHIKILRGAKGWRPLILPYGMRVPPYLA